MKPPFLLHAGTILGGFFTGGSGGFRGKGLLGFAVERAPINPRSEGLPHRSCGGLFLGVGVSWNSIGIGTLLKMNMEVERGP